MKTTFFIACFAAAFSFTALGQDPAPPKLGTPGALIISTAFDKDAPKTRKASIAGWSAGIGVWWIEKGALHGDEVAEDHHPSSCTWRFEATDLILTAQFRLGTAEHIAFGCRDTVPPNLHLGRTFVTKDAIWVTRMSGISKTTKSEKLAELKTKLDPEAWHSITIEIIGDHYRATVDGHVVEARHERYKDAKGLVALISKGQGAQFKNVAIWHAKPNG